MHYQRIDLANYPRREHFAYFSSLAYPYVGLTVNVDITGCLARIKREGLPFFLTVCYCASRAANAVPALRQRILKVRRSIQEDPEEVLDKLFISSLPWVSYTALVQPVPQPADSHPRISWGKYFLQEGRTLLPVSILCHHALVDGLHLAAFYRALDLELAEAAG